VFSTGLVKVIPNVSCSLAFRNLVSFSMNVGSFHYRVISRDQAGKASFARGGAWSAAGEGFIFDYGTTLSPADALIIAEERIWPAVGR
jgi:hypothetical protein